VNTLVGIERMRTLLREEVRKAGGATAWARKNGVSPQYVSDVLLNGKSMGPALARPLGFELVTMYRPRRWAETT